MSFDFRKDSKKDSGVVRKTAINTPQRPGSLDVKALQVDVFPYDAFEFDDPDKTANPRVKLRDPWVWEVESEINALDQEVTTNAVKLAISTTSVVYNRSLIPTPTNLLLEGLHDDGSAYAGRFKIVLIYDEDSEITAYTSSADEATKSYAIPVTVEVAGTVYRVNNIVCNIYASGGTSKLLDTKSCSLNLNSSSTYYWGALTAAPSSDFILGDYYFDSNLPIAGGGEIRYYNGISWEVATTAWPGYEDAWAQARVDAYNWMTEKATDVEEAVKLATATASAMAAKQIVSALPSSPYIGYSVGDIVVLTTDSKLYRLTVTGWTNATDGADIDDDTVTIDKLLVKGTGKYINLDPDIEDQSNWEQSGLGTIAFYDDTTAPTGDNCIGPATTALYVCDKNYYPLDISKKYRVRFWVKRSSDANGILYMSLRQYTEPGVVCSKNGGRSPYKPNAYIPTTDWVELSYEWGASDWQAGVRYIRLDWLINYGGTTGKMYIHNPRFEEVLPGTLIEDGAITTNKIYAGAVTAAKIAVADLAASAAFISALEASTAYIEMLGTNTALANYLGANTALINTLTAQTAFIEALFAQQITVPDGGRIRYETGAGVQKRCVQLADEKIDWLDTPDTTPASSEVLRARIGRLGVGGAILMDGDFLISTEPRLSPPFELADGYVARGSTAIQDSKGNVRVAWSTNTLLTGGKIYERVWNGSTWTGIIELTDYDAIDPTYYETNDGVLRCAWRKYSNGYIYEKIWNGSTWGTDILIFGGAANYPTYAQLDNGLLRCAYRKVSDKLVYESFFDGVVWGSEALIGDCKTSSKASFVKLSNGELYIMYYTFGIKYRKLLDTGWSNETPLSSDSGNYFSSLKSISGVDKITYRRSSDGYIVQQTWDGKSLGSVEIIYAANVTSPSYVVTLSGSEWIIYTESATVQQRSLERYARVGAGIIKQGNDGCLFGNGVKHFLGRWYLNAYFTPGVWHDVCSIYGRATIMAISSENQYMQPWLINFGWNTFYGQMISATMNPDMGHTHSRDFQWRVVDAGGGRGKLQTAAISYSTGRSVTFNVALLGSGSSIDWLIGAI